MCRNGARLGSNWLVYYAGRWIGGELCFPYNGILNGKKDRTARDIKNFQI
jgi:hypothetical protein